MLMEYFITSPCKWAYSRCIDLSPVNSNDTTYNEVFKMWFTKDKKDKHIEKISVNLTESGILIRLIFMTILLAVAAYSFYYIFTKVLHTESGWQTIPAKTKTGIGSEFVFHYNLGATGNSASLEWGRLNKLYPQLLDRGEALYGDEEIAGVGNLYQLNSKPNQEVILEPEVYAALQKLQNMESRFIFLAPVFAEYKALFTCEDDYAASNFDPFWNEEMRRYLLNLCNYINISSNIYIELLGNNTAKLVVSQEYLDFAKENEITKFIDFYYAKNAFVIDYVADKLIEDGYTAGVISCIEGFTRAMGSGEYTTKLFYYHEGMAPDEKTYTYNGPKSLVALRTFQVFDEESKYFYRTDVGEYRHIYIDPYIGLCREGDYETFEDSDTLGCSDIFFPLYEAFCR